MLITATTPDCESTAVSEDRLPSPSWAIDTALEENLTELDARSPSPPKVLPAILAAMKDLPLGRPQFVRTANAPVELLRALEVHGVEACPIELPDGSWRTLLILSAPRPR